MKGNLLAVPHPSPETHGPVFISQPEACRITGRSRRTVQRWIRRRRISDPLALDLLQRELHGILPAPWHTWRVHGATLIDDTGRTWTIAELNTAQVNAQLVGFLRQRVAALERRCEDLEQALAERPLERLRRAARALGGRVG